MSAKVAFLAAETPRGLASTVIIPRKALVTDAMGNAVWTVRDGLAHRVAIEPGRELQDGVEVLRGLDGGELVIIDPPPELKEGARVATPG